MSDLTKLKAKILKTILDVKGKYGNVCKYNVCLHPQLENIVHRLRNAKMRDMLSIAMDLTTTGSLFGIKELEDLAKEISKIIEEDLRVVGRKEVVLERTVEEYEFLGHKVVKKIIVKKGVLGGTDIEICSAMFIDGEVSPTSYCIVFDLETIDILLDAIAEALDKYRSGVKDIDVLSTKKKLVKYSISKPLILEVTISRIGDLIGICKKHIEPESGSEAGFSHCINIPSIKGLEMLLEILWELLDGDKKVSHI